MKLLSILSESTTNEVWHKNLEYKKPNMLHNKKPFTGVAVKYYDEKTKVGDYGKQIHSEEDVKKNQPYSITPYKDGKQHGDVLGFAKNGKTVSDGEFKDGKGVGRHKFYTDNGKLYAYRDYTNGVGGEVVKVGDSEETVKEHMSPSDTPVNSDLDFGGLENLMVQALFKHEGGWGSAPRAFLLYITPGGTIRAIKNSVYSTQRDHNFKEGQQINLSDLVEFERNSKFDLQMKGRLRDYRIKEEKSNVHPIITYMENMKPHYDLLDDYIKLRVYFKNAGYSEEDLKSVKRAPQWVFEIQNRFPMKVEKMKIDLKKIGLMDDIYGPQSEILMDYLKSEMKKIDLEFPMNSPENSYVPPIMKNPSHLI